MKNLMLVLILAVLIGMPQGSFAQQEKSQTPATPAGPKRQVVPKQSMPHSGMGHHEEMMSKKKEMDARLDEKIAAMDAAKGEQKVEAMAAVIKEMVAQRKEMQQRMMQMGGGMEGGHMGHGGEGMKKEMGGEKAK